MLSSSVRIRSKDLLSVTSKSQWLVAAGFLALLCVTAWAFSPGLGGGLIFDDVPNLQPWADLGDIDSLHKLLAFVFSSKFLPGRPLSLLSFLVDDQSWPVNVVTLKRTNLALHLVNTCLVYWLSLQLIRRLLPEQARKAGLLSLVVAAIWALHPIQVSNVSYIIQRMNLLETTLALTALLLFMAGRGQLAQRPRRALLLCSIAIGGLMPLAVLAKENGLLICAFALLIEAYCYPEQRTRLWRAWKAAFLWLPLAVFLLYCLVTYRGFTTGFETRNFNAWERLLSEGPVMVDYLHKLLLPHLRGSGLYFDNFPVSRSLTEPATLASWAVITALVALALWLRFRLPLVSFGILFYFCGHLMESTVLPLELYFEHRNYLPQAGLWLAVAGLLAIPVSRRLRVSQAVLILAFLAILTAMTRDNAALWGQPDVQAAVWYRDNPGSLRNILGYANALKRSRDINGLRQVLAEGARRYPNSLSILLSQRLARCYGENLPTRFDDLPAFARHADYDTGSIVTLEYMRKHGSAAKSDADKCDPLSDRQIADIYLGMLQNPHFQPAASTLLGYLADIAIKANDYRSAVGYYVTAFRRAGNPIDGYHAASLLAAMGARSMAHGFAVDARRRVGWHDRLQHPDLLPLLDGIMAETAAGRPGAAQ